ncbi:hypothetical protein C882_0294 [Caenispirillum salinarum AK4]|uniref:Chaperone NapD n=1 Tax=Caenispirillum salinarum AK4 TaxID=1238182 RepID=K9GW42_9PROT|nr:chaperone NapD [Caenispirillum salinarum]EKV29472.1 hypothetical protein C882_0294 [Caenispirillum salinarum AK4]
MKDCVHISSAIIHAQPHTADAVCERITRTMPGVEIPVAEGGKLVATLETETEHAIVERLDAIALMDGVMSVSLIYHHFEPLDALERDVAGGTTEPEQQPSEGGTAP